MREVERIKPFLEKIEEVWMEVPDWRFGQLMVNFFNEVGDPFYMEEKEFEEKLKIFINDLKK